MLGSIDIRVADTSRWDDVRALFGASGATEGCWCMYWRCERAEYERNRGDANRDALSQLCRRWVAPGLLAYLDRMPVGWCSVAPRDEFVRLSHAPTLAPVDDREAWSVPCFFVDRSHRRSGVASALLRGAVDHAAEHGAQIVEGYPTDTSSRGVENGFANTGVISLFESNGFSIAAQRGRRVVMRRYL